VDIKENKEATEKLEASKEAEAMKAAFQAELAADMPSSKQLIRNALFGEGRLVTT
jgi:hypothetical protein